MDNNRYNRYLLFSHEYWQIKFIGRDINENYFRLFTHNGNYTSDDEVSHPEYFLNGIVINLKPVVKDNKISQIGYYKVRDHGIYYRGSDDVSLNAHDRKIFCELLSECTDSVAGEILVDATGVVPQNGWNIKSVGKKNITMVKGEEKISVPKSYMEEIIDVGRTYPDILFSEDCWEINAKNLKVKYKDPILAVLSNIDRGKYPGVFAKTAAEKIAEEDCQSELEDSLIEAIKAVDCDAIGQILPSIKTISSEAVDEAIIKH